MSDLPYLMQDPVKDELWLVTSETRLLITPEIYDLLASNGAELPDAYGIKELREQNAKLRELLAEDNEELSKMRRAIDYLYSFAKACGVDAEDMHELGVEVDK